MEEEYYADRAVLRQLRSQHPTWHIRDFMVATNRSRSWVKKWFKRFAAALPDDDSVLRGLSHVPKHPPPGLNSAVVERILDIRDHPPDHLRRVPGPKAIQYFLGTDAALQADGKVVHPSTRTIWEVLVAHGRIVPAKPVEPEPVERPAPMSAWELDFKDVSSVRGEPEGKRQHALECLNVVDKGTSILVDFRLHRDFNAQTVLEAIVNVLRQHGLPTSMTIDRDVRFIGSVTARDFPSALVRFLECIGVDVIVCPPRQPQEKPFVERYNGTYDRECLKPQHPADQAQAQAATEQFMQHYNFERPHQGVSCANQPPRVAFSQLPVLPSLPELVDPDAWLKYADRRPYLRRINQNGCIKIDNHIYYVKRALAGQHVLVTVDATTGEFVVEHRHAIIKRLAIQGLLRHQVALEMYIDLMLAQAQSEWRRYLASHLVRRQLAA